MHHFETVLDKSLRAAVLLADLVGFDGIFGDIRRGACQWLVYTANPDALRSRKRLAASDSLNFADKDRVESLPDILGQVRVSSGLPWQQSWLVLVARLPG